MNLLSHRVIQSFADKIDTAGYRVDFRDNGIFASALGDERQLLWGKELLQSANATAV